MRFGTYSKSKHIIALSGILLNIVVLMHNIRGFFHKGISLTTIIYVSLHSDISLLRRDDVFAKHFSSYGLLMLFYWPCLSRNYCRLVNSLA